MQLSCNVKATSVLIGFQKSEDVGMIQVRQDVDFRPQLIHVFDRGTSHLFDGHCFLAIITALSTENTTKRTSSKLIFFRPNKMIMHSSCRALPQYEMVPLHLSKKKLKELQRSGVSGCTKELHSPPETLTKSWPFKQKWQGSV